MTNFILFFNSFFSYLVLFAIMVVLVIIAVIVGIKWRKSKDLKASLEAGLTEEKKETATP